MTILTFGVHKGKPIGDVDPGYLQWLVKKAQTDHEDYIHAGINWTEMARQQLGQSIAKVNTGGKPMAFEDIDKAPEPAKKVLLIGGECIDQLTLNQPLLKKFILRQEQTEGLYTWVKKLWVEGEQYGNKTLLQNKDASVTLYQTEYSGLCFEYTLTVNSKVLQRVKVV